MSDLATLLLEQRYIDINQLDSARAQQEYTGKRIEHILVESRMVPERNLVDYISRVTRIPEVDLAQVVPRGDALAKMKGTDCFDLAVLPLELENNGRTLVVAVTDPVDIGHLDHIMRLAGCRVRTMVAGVNAIRRAVRKYYFGEEVEEEGIDLPPEDEFKITDMSGNTVMTSIDQLRRQDEARRRAQAAASAQASPSPPPRSDLFGGDLFDIKALSPQERARLSKLEDHMEKSRIVLQSVLELLVEKGVARREELRSALTNRSG
ncbi:MAG: hypothetical protein D6729_14810 [Deltaproteobacteria bacterium]|nr:MAG: hypothetical protein D6729_14810 [Deltaproteobacteria bacterium]